MLTSVTCPHCGHTDHPDMFDFWLSELRPVEVGDWSYPVLRAYTVAAGSLFCPACRCEVDEVERTSEVYEVRL